MCMLLSHKQFQHACFPKGMPKTKLTVLNWGDTAHANLQSLFFSHTLSLPLYSLTFALILSTSAPPFLSLFFHLSFSLHIFHTHPFPLSHSICIPSSLSLPLPGISQRWRTSLFFLSAFLISSAPPGATPEQEMCAAIREKADTAATTAVTLRSGCHLTSPSRRGMVNLNGPTALLLSPHPPHSINVFCVKIKNTWRCRAII